MACVRLLAYVSLLVTACISLTPPLCCASARANKQNTDTDTADTDTDTHAHGNGHAPQRDQTYIYAPQRDQTYSASRRLLAAALPAPLPSLQNTRTTPQLRLHQHPMPEKTRHAARGTRQTSWAGDALLGQSQQGHDGIHSGDTCCRIRRLPVHPLGCSSYVRHGHLYTHRPGCVCLCVRNRQIGRCWLPYRGLAPVRVGEVQG